MSKINGRVLGEGRDLPLVHAIGIGSASAGSAADPAEAFIGMLPDLAKSWLPTRLPSSPTSNQLGGEPKNWSQIRQAGFVNTSGSDVVPASASHYYDWRLNVRRGGVLYGTIAYYSMRVLTDTGATTCAANSFATVTPTSMTGIVPGMLLAIDTSTSLEYVYVISTTSTTFTAYFVKSHSAGVAVSSVVPAWLPLPFIPAVGVNTTSATSITPGSHSFTPASMYGILVGSQLTFSGGTGTAETVTVTAVTNTTATATFANSHSGGYTITRTDGKYFELQGGDVLTLLRLSNDATGLASPAGNCYFEFNPSGLLD